MPQLFSPPRLSEKQLRVLAVEDQEEADEKGQQAHSREIGHEGLAHLGGRTRTPGRRQ